MNKVYFIGAGPGDPDLITVKGRKIIEKADVIIYAGSLVCEEILQCRKKESLLYNSAGMTLEEVIDVMVTGYRNHQLVARVHTGDTSLFSTIREQIDILEQKQIDLEVVPGVSSFSAAAASLKKELTLPDVTQTVICTRISGRTAVPAGETLKSLAVHQSSMAIFLSVGMIHEVTRELLVYYPADTPAAVVEKASWPDERIVKGTLTDIAAKVTDAGISKTAMILVGNFLGDHYAASRLYDKTFTHGYRTAECGQSSL